MAWSMKTTNAAASFERRQRTGIYFTQEYVPRESCRTAMDTLLWTRHNGRCREKAIGQRPSALTPTTQSARARVSALCLENDAWLDNAASRYGRIECDSPSGNRS